MTTDMTQGDDMTTKEENQLIKAQTDRGRLLFLAKQSYIAQLHPRSVLAQSLLEEIRRHEPGWAPPKSAVGSR